MICTFNDAIAAYRLPESLFFNRESRFFNRLVWAAVGEGTPRVTEEAYNLGASATRSVDEQKLQDGGWSWDDWARWMRIAHRAGLLAYQGDGMWGLSDEAVIAKEARCLLARLLDCGGVQR